MKKQFLWCSVFLCMLWMSTRIPVFQQAYLQHEQRLENDAWLLKQCNTPDFFVRMSHHSDLCERLMLSANSILAPTWIVALRACLPQFLLELAPFDMTWQTWILLVAGFLFSVPMILWPFYCAREEQMEQLRLLEACSPQIKSNISFLRRRRPIVW